MENIIIALQDLNCTPCEKARNTSRLAIKCTLEEANIFTDQFFGKVSKSFKVKFFKTCETDCVFINTNIHHTIRGKLRNYNNRKTRKCDLNVELVGEYFTLTLTSAGFRQCEYDAQA